MKRSFSGITLEDAMQLVHAERFTSWQMNETPRPPSDVLHEVLRRLRCSFDLENTELSKTLLIDALFAEIVPEYPNLKVWKAAPLESDTLMGIADYLITPDRAFIATPLLCVAEAKRDDFVQGRAQCVAEMAACLWKNQQKSYADDVFGIVSNGQNWQFYKLTGAGEVFESDLLAMNDLPRLLGALDHVCAECARQIP